MNRASGVCMNRPWKDEKSFEELHAIRRVQNVKWRVGLKIMVALALILAAQSRLSAYLLQEALVVVLSTAVLLLLILLTVIALLLLWQGASFVLLRLTRSVGRITRVRDHSLALNRR